MTMVHLDLDGDLVALLRATNEPLERAARELTVLELYRRRTISSGKAAELLGLSRCDFISYASGLGIPFFALSQVDWETERRTSRSL
jgi:predicted HTH domain antitoxin